MPFADKTLTCRDCGTSFTFTVGEQEFHAEKGFTNEPGRCPSCRAQRRSERGDTGFSRGSGGYGSQRELFSATCASCGKQAQVPFQPRGDRPVYCSDCFRSQQGSSSSSGGSSRSGGYGDSSPGTSGEGGSRGGRRGSSRGGSHDRGNRW